MSNALVIAVRRRRCWPARLVYLALDWALAVVLAVALLIVAERVFLPAGWVCGLVGLLEVHRARRAGERFLRELADWREGYELRSVSSQEWAALALDMTFTALEAALVTLIVSQVGR